MRQIVLIRQNALIVAILGLFFAAIAGAAFSFQRQLDDQQWVKHSLFVRSALLKALSTLQDAETNQRGFLLTGDDTFLSVYRAASDRIPVDLQTLEGELADNPIQIARFRKLRWIVDNKLLLLAKDLVDRPSPGRRTIRSDDLGTGKKLMDSAGAVVGEMTDEENRLLEARDAGAQRTAALVQSATIITIMLAFWLGWVILKECERREQAEEQLRQSQKMEAVGQLTGGIAHDFNNMLAVVVGCLNLLKRKLNLADPGLDELIEKAMEAVERAANLTHRLLAFSRQQPLVPQVIDLNKLVANMAEVLRRTLGESIQVETNLASALWRLSIDPNQLENALLNIAVNARDAMPNGGKLTIETTNATIGDTYARQQMDVPEGQYVLLAITDTGVGMSDELIKKAVEPFFTTKMPGKGTGLGLSQVYGFISQSGGYLKIYSVLGCGTTVKIYLPRYAGEDEETPVTPMLVKAKPTSLPTGKAEEAIVVVEDDGRVRSVVVGMLRELGYNVMDTADAKKALQILQTICPVSLLLTDIVMPDMNGRTLSEEARMLQPDLKILFITGFSGDIVIQNGMVDRGVNFLPKPFTLEQLATKVREVIDKPPAKLVV